MPLFIYIFNNFLTYQLFNFKIRLLLLIFRWIDLIMPLFKLSFDIHILLNCWKLTLIIIRCFHIHLLPILKCDLVLILLFSLLYHWVWIFILFLSTYVYTFMSLFERFSKLLLTIVVLILTSILCRHCHSKVTRPNEVRVFSWLLKNILSSW